jgi:hypothetical protein
LEASKYKMFTRSHLNPPWVCWQAPDILAMQEVMDMRIIIRVSLDLKQDAISKLTKAKMTEVGSEHLPSKCEVLRSTPSTAK